MSAELVTAGISRPNDVWWQGALFRLRGRRETTGGVMGVVEANFWAGMGTPLHIHHREDEAFYVLDGAIRFRLAEDEFTATSGDFVFGPREVAHCFKVLEPGARALVLITPAGLEQMFVEGGIPVSDPTDPPSREYDLEDVRRLALKYGFDVIGPPLD
jgi:quercetin dioxygenase-like cupin family protein